MKFYLVAIMVIFISACSIDPEELEKSGKYEKALELYREKLTEDYQNIDLRVKFTLCYFKNAMKYIEQNDLEEAERNIERGTIYNKEDNPQIKNQYAQVILSLGKKLVSIGDLDGSVEMKKKYQKGYDLIEKAVFLSDDNTEAKEVFNQLNSDLSEKYLQKGKELFFLWRENSKNYKTLTESLKFAEQSLIFYPNNINARELQNNILEKLLYESPREQDLSFKIMKIFHNTQTRISAFKIRFYNDDTDDVIISPDQFTLYDDKDNAYIFDKESASNGNYTGVMNRIRVSPSHFTSGLLVFNTGVKNPVISSIVWRNSAGVSYEKEFPGKKLMDLIVEQR
ncbi:MAG: tetratricopeptide repeat protein [Candidatus Delongbacteria bacterium]|nr:tetratricopeptide repeat protein [Candidatus Delongbacteria bacterium]